MLASYKKSLCAAFLVVFYLGLSLSAYAQSGNSTSVTGTVVDPSGAVVDNSSVLATSHRCRNTPPLTNRLLSGEKAR